MSPGKKISHLQKDAKVDQDKNGGRKKKREYVPQKRSGGYAVLLALYRESQISGSKGFMFKMELQTEAQQYCDKSFTVVSQTATKYGAQLLIRLTLEQLKRLFSSSVCVCSQIWAASTQPGPQ